MGNFLVATLVRQNTSVHPLQHVAGCASPAIIQHFAVDRHDLPNLVFTNLYGHALNDVARDRTIADAHAGTSFFQRDFIIVGDYNCGDKEGQLGWLLANCSGQLAHVESRYGTSNIPTTRPGTKRIDHALCNNDLFLVDHMQFVGPRDHDLVAYSCVDGEQPCRYVRPSLRMWAEASGNVDDLIDELSAMSERFDSALVDGHFDEAWRLLSNAAENHLCVLHGLRRSADWRPVHQERDNKHKGVMGVNKTVVLRRLLKLLRQAKQLAVDPDNKKLRFRAVATLHARSIVSTNLMGLLVLASRSRSQNWRRLLSVNSKKRNKDALTVGAADWTVTGSSKGNGYAAAKVRLCRSRLVTSLWIPSPIQLRRLN